MQDFAESAGKELVLSFHSLSVVTEAYRELRTAILLSRAEEPPKTILFTSSVPAEGKTTTVLNTAILFAQMGVRVLVIDADLRRPGCHKTLGLRNGLGLTEVLTGQREVHEMVKALPMPNLFFLTSGTASPNPTELVGSRKMYETLSNSRSQIVNLLYGPEGGQREGDEGPAGAVGQRFCPGGFQESRGKA